MGDEVNDGFEGEVHCCRSDIVYLESYCYFIGKKIFLVKIVRLQNMY